MTDSEQQHIEDNDITEFDKTNKRKDEAQKKSERSQIVNSYESIDSMRIIDVKEALKVRNLTTTGNKIELKKRLQEAIARNSDLCITEKELRENRIANKEDMAVRKEVNENETTDDDKTSEEDIEHKKERFIQMQGKRRGNTVQNNKERRNKIRQYEEDKSENSDTSIESENGINGTQQNRHRNTHVSSNSEYLHNNFTIKDVEGSLTNFSDDVEISN